MTRPEIHIFPTTHLASVWTADFITERARRAVAARGRFTFALSGGTAPAETYRLLVEREMPWTETHIYWADERCVPPDHPDNNYRQASEVLLAHVPIPPEHIHRINGEDPDPERAAAQYERDLPARFDLLLLGVGEDGHTASLFPRHPALRETERRVLAITDSPKPPPCRVTITPPTITAARQTLALAFGPAKADAVARALTGPEDMETTPAQLVRRGLWVLDREAGKTL